MLTLLSLLLSNFNEFPLTQSLRQLRLKPCWISCLLRLQKQTCVPCVIDHFYMTSRRPYLCTKQWIGGHVCVQKKSCGNWTFFPSVLKLSFIPSNLQSCWPRDWKRSVSFTRREKRFVEEELFNFRYFSFNVLKKYKYLVSALHNKEILDILLIC